MMSMRNGDFFSSSGIAQHIEIKREVPSPNNSLDSEDMSRSPFHLQSSSFSQSSSPVSETSKSTSKTMEKELCLICGDRASGYHYNALSCEGCKGFFRRSITRRAVYKCKAGGQCKMDMWMRRRCQACRIQRCHEVGMRKECLLTVDQCKARERHRKSRKRIAEKVTMKQPNFPTLSSALQEPKKPGDIFPKLNPSDRHLIEGLVYYQDYYELPNDTDLQMLVNVKVRSMDVLSMSDAIFQQMAGMTILVTHLVVEFAKQMPGFSELNDDSKIALLKGSACEVMMIRTARRYDYNTDTIIFADGSPFTREKMRIGGLHDYTDNMFNFCRKIYKLRVDNTEYALLTALILFSPDRPLLTDRDIVENLQEAYTNTLSNYVTLRRANSANYLAKLLMCLTSLRDLSHDYDKVLANMKIEKGPLPPLLAEYFDMGS